MAISEVPRPLKVEWGTVTQVRGRQVLGRVGHGRAGRLGGRKAAEMQGYSPVEGAKCRIMNTSLSQVGR